MSRARPPLQLNLRGAFDHATDLNDHLVIERRSRVFKTETLSGDGEKREGGSKDESEIIIVSGDALMHGKMSFPGLGCNCITRLYNKVLLLLWILANYCFLDQKYLLLFFFKL